MHNKRQATTIGRYNGHGYEVAVVSPAGEILKHYEAGNSMSSSAPADSVPLDSIYAVRIEVLKDFCEETAREMAEEYNATFAGVELIEEEEDQNA